MIKRLIVSVKWAEGSCEREYTLHYVNAHFITSIKGTSGTMVKQNRMQLLLQLYNSCFIYISLGTISPCKFIKRVFAGAGRRAARRPFIVLLHRTALLRKFRWGVWANANWPSFRLIRNRGITVKTRSVCETEHRCHRVQLGPLLILKTGEKGVWTVNTAIQTTVFGPRAGGDCADCWAKVWDFKKWEARLGRFEDSLPRGQLGKWVLAQGYSRGETEQRHHW